MFTLCVPLPVGRAAEEEQQAQSKKGLKKQQKEAEKAAKKAEKQAKLVSVALFCLSGLSFHIRRPLFQLVQGTAGPGGAAMSIV